MYLLAVGLEREDEEDLMRMNCVIILSSQMISTGSPQICSGRILLLLSPLL